MLLRKWLNLCSALNTGTDPIHLVESAEIRLDLE